MTTTLQLARQAEAIAIATLDSPPKAREAVRRWFLTRNTATPEVRAYALLLAERRVSRLFGDDR